MFFETSKCFTKSAIGFQKRNFPISLPDFALYYKKSDLDRLL